jgi:Abnormal spindle-like microcephaly-assoc'd, ASPM-SPD-2-Hydin
MRVRARLRATRRQALVSMVVGCGLITAAVATTSVPALAGGRSTGFVRATAWRAATVDVRAIAAERAGQPGGRRAPFLRPAAATAGAARASHPRVVDAGTATSTTAAATLSASTAFPVMSLDRQISSFGSGQDVTPPDTQLAAGPTSLLETLNDSGSVWSKTGGLLSSFDLGVFFPVPTGSYFSDPRVLYDAPTGRWFISGLSFTPPFYGSVVYLAVSSGSDPTGTWTVYAADSTSDILHDQPKIGVSADKVVMSWNDFLSASAFLGETTYVWQKSQLLAASSSVAIAGVVDDGSRNSLVPAQALGYASSDTNAYVVYNKSASAGVLTVTGTPLQNNVGWTESDPGIAATSTPPSADQPGAPGSIATNDDRFLTAVVQGGSLWTSGNDACVPSGDTSTRPCARFVAVAIPGNTVTQDFDLAATGAGVYYPAVGLDGSGNMLAVYSISSTSAYPGVRVTGQSGGSLLAGQTVKSGEALYNDSPCYAASPPSRWGDYSSAAVDPTTTGDVWLTGEYAAASSLTVTNGCAWGTYTSELSVGTSTPAPVASVSPASISFGNQAVGTTSSQHTVTVTNTGNANLVIPAGGVTVTDPTDFKIGSDTCASGTTSVSVAPGSSCAFVVTFAPASVGTFSATIAIVDNAAGSPQTVALSGSGVKRRHH